MKALKKQLVAAVAMLLVATIALSSSTFAWFSMNTQVTATNMQVTAKSDNTYLLISKTNDTATAIQAENLTTVDLTDAGDPTKVFPSAPAKSSDEIGYLTTSGKDVTGTTITTAGAEVTNEATASAVTNWYTANAAAPSAAAIDATTARQLTAFTGYVVKKTVYLTVAAGANNANNLSVTGTFAQKASGTDITASRILVTTSDGGFAILTSAAPTADIKGSNTALTSSTIVTVNLYIYYDGNDSAVYTNNAVNLTGATMNVAFNVEPVAAT